MNEDHGWFCPECSKFYPYLKPEDVADSGGMFACFPTEVTQRLFKSTNCCMQKWSEYQFPFGMMQPTGDMKTSDIDITPYPFHSSASNPSDCRLAYETSGGICSMCGRRWEDCRG